MGYLVCEKNLNALMAIILACILFGAFGIQFFLNETPCPLCLLQRLGMLGLASGALMNVRFGPKRIHYGIALLSSFFGGFVALRQITLHVCPGSSVFGKPFWGLSLYTWSFITFVCSIVFVALIFIIFDKQEREENPPINWLGNIAFVLIFAAAFINIFTTFWQCGLGPCADV